MGEGGEEGRCGGGEGTVALVLFRPMEGDRELAGDEEICLRVLGPDIVPAVGVERMGKKRKSRVLGRELARAQKQRRAREEERFGLLRVPCSPLSEKKPVAVRRPRNREEQAKIESARK